MATDLTRIGSKARKDRRLVFTSLYHHVCDIDRLRASHEALDAHKAIGIDGVTKKEYGENLEENLRDLSERLKRMGYRPKAKRRSSIPKAGSKKGRPIGISSYEDKIVERALKEVLEEIYEADFEDSSYGYRPMLTPHQCLDHLGRTIQQGKISYVVEADIRSFFDTVEHTWLMKFLRHRIGDERVLRLITRMLKAGVMNGETYETSEKGTAQGSIISPLLGNIYLHYVLDLWFNRRVAKQSRGEARIFRYADDFVACFQYRSDAEEFMHELAERLAEFGLRLAMEKTKCLAFGRFARKNAGKRGGKPESFTFLGFDHYSGKTRNGKFKVKRRTNRKKLNAGLRKHTEWCEQNRRWMRKKEMVLAAKRRVIGHLNYYAITDNSPRCGEYLYHAQRTLFKWLNRKSQRRSYTWEGVNQLLTRVDWPTSTVRKDLSPFRRQI